MGNRPSFGHAAPPELAESLHEHFCETLRAERVPVQTGARGRRMQVALVNDARVRIIVDVSPTRSFWTVRDIAVAGGMNENCAVLRPSRRCAVAETYPNGVWFVKAGEEDAFVSAWRDFASCGPHLARSIQAIQATLFP